MKSISIKDVAAEAGVAIGSVSRALNGRNHVSPALRARVKEAASRLGYEPHAQARGLRLGRSNTIGLIVNDLRHPMYSAVVAAVERELSAHGQLLLLGNALGDPARERAILRTFERSAVDGAIVAASLYRSAQEGTPYADVGLPLALIDLDVPGMDRVCIERRNGTRIATRHLITLGHRRIALLTPALDRIPGGDRAAGYGDALRQAGLGFDPVLIPEVGSPLQDGCSLMLQLLDQEAPPTALICLGTRLLSGALKALRLRGLSVPDDFSVIAIGMPEMLELANPPLTCLRMDLVSLAKASVQMLLRRLAGNPGRPAERTEHETELIVRDSCAPPPKRAMA